MKSRRNQQRRTRRKTQRRRSRSQRRQPRSLRRLRGGALTAIPTGAVVDMRLDPKDPYSIPISVSKETAEEIIEDTFF